MPISAKREMEPMRIFLGADNDELLQKKITDSNEKQLNIKLSTISNSFQGGRLESTCKIDY